MRFRITDVGAIEYPFEGTAQKIDAILEGLKEVPHTRTQFYDFCGWLFQQVSDTITSFPTDLIQDPQTIKLTLIFSGVSAGLVALFSIGEGLKGVLGMKYTKLADFIGRSAIAFLGAGLTLPALVFMMRTVSMVCQWLLSIGRGAVSGQVLFSSVLAEILNDGAINFVVAIFFMIVFCLFAMKALLDTGVRWYDMICNTIISPVAWCCLVTDSTKAFFDKWLSSTTGLFLTNLTYAFYLTVVCAIALGPWQVNTVGLFGRLLLIVGAFWRLIHPPGWLKNPGGEGGNALKYALRVFLMKGMKPKL